MKVKVLVAQVRGTLCNSIDYSHQDASVHGISMQGLLWMGIHSLFQRIVLIQGSFILHRQILFYHLSSPGQLTLLYKYKYKVAH